MKAKCPHCFGELPDCNHCEDGFKQVSFAIGKLYTRYCPSCKFENGGRIADELPADKLFPCVMCNSDRVQWLLVEEATACRGQSRRVLEYVVMEWEPWSGGDDLRRRIKQRMAADDEYGNPLIFLWIIGLVIQMMWQLWLRRNKLTRGDELKALQAEAQEAFTARKER